jgi:hypothetical protein
MKEIILSNGCTLVPGGRIRIKRAQLSEINTDLFNSGVLSLDDSAWSYDSEVIQWFSEEPQ